jgi:membrane protein implicated in regulation of membrane protease activity
MAAYAVWFIMALVLLGLEMATGTFYMLVLSVAVASGGVAALAGIIILNRIKKVRPAHAANIGMDIGQPVRVVTWNADGTARVQYRGAEWDAEAELPDTPRDATLYIKALHGSKLILTQHKPKS